jgi:hypothetical protein
MLIGRQESTGVGGIIDLLAIVSSSLNLRRTHHRLSGRPRHPDQCAVLPGFQ